MAEAASTAPPALVPRLRCGCCLTASPQSAPSCCSLRGLISGLLWCAPRTCNSRLHARLHGSPRLRSTVLLPPAAQDLVLASPRGLLSGVPRAFATPGSGSTPLCSGSTPLCSGSTPLCSGSTPLCSGSTPLLRLHAVMLGSPRLGSSAPLLPAAQSVVMAALRGLLSGVLRCAPRTRDSRLRAF